MRTNPTLLAAVLFVFLSSEAAGQNPGDNIFSGIQVHSINIHLAQPGYWDSLTAYYEAGNEQYMAATIVVNGVTYDSVGVRFKGNASYYQVNQKRPFRLSFDEYKPAQRWDGEKGIHLNNCWEDPTFIREKLHLDFCQTAGVSAPRANFAQVFINDTLFGFYSMVEHVDKRFLETHYGDASGDLFKATDAFSVDELSDFLWYGPDAPSYFDHYELKTEESLTAWPRLVELIDTLNHTQVPITSLQRSINLKAFYKVVAIDNLLGNIDTYVHIGQNFYFYFNPATRKMEWIFWDAGLSIGGMPEGATVPDIENMSVDYVVDPATRPLFGRIVGSSVLKNQYLKSLWSIFNNNFSVTQLNARIDSIANIIRPYVYLDERNEYSPEAFEINIESDMNVGSGRKPGLKSFLALRDASVRSQLGALGITGASSVNPGDLVINEFMAENDSIYDGAGEPDDWIEIYNRTTQSIDVGGMYLSNNTDDPLGWQIPAGTTIPPDGYLIIWADDDEGQPGLHANFTLPLSAGHIMLADADQTILDEVSYGTQAANRVMARIPNGTGPFRQGRATFNAANGSTIVNDPALTAIILPQYIEGINGTNANRLPFAYRARFTGLVPSSTYRYFNQIVTSADPVTTSGSSNCIFATQSGDFVRTSGPSMATVGNHGSFVTDTSGAYEGWFINEPTGNARFVPSKYVFMRIMLNDGGAGTSVNQRLTLSDSVRVLKLDPAANDSCGTGLRCTSLASPKDFVFLYDNVNGTGRPIAGTFVENDGTSNTTANSYAAFYSSYVNAVDGAFGVVIPNLLASGVRRVERRGLQTGALVDSSVDDDGIWPSGASTINPSGGTTEIVLSGSDVPLPIQLASFTGCVITGGSVRLDWTTTSEVNNFGFYVQRKRVNESEWDELSNSFIAGNGTSNEPHSYSFVDRTPSVGSWHYRLHQVDLDGTSHFSEAIIVEMITSVDGKEPIEFSLKQNFPNPFNPSTKISFSVQQLGVASLTVCNVLGEVVSVLFSGSATPGTRYDVVFNADRLPSGVYFYTLRSGLQTATRKMLLIH